MSNAEQDYYAEIVELRTELEMAEATIRESREAQRRMGSSVATLRTELERVTAERDAARAAAATLRKWGATWRSIAWGYEIADDVQIFDNQRQLWATSRPRDCMGRRVDE